MIEGKADLLKACKHRKMKVAEIPANLLETQIQAEGLLDGMEVRIESDCIVGMPGESKGTVTIRGNLAQILAVLARVWPAAPSVQEVFSPGRQSWPDCRTQPEKEKPTESRRP